MTEVFDMNMNELFGEDSEFIESFSSTLEDLGINIDSSSLATILHEYEMAKMDFLKLQIIRMLESKGQNPEGPVKVVVSQSGFGFEPGDDADFDEFDLDYTDANLIS